MNQADGLKTKSAVMHSGMESNMKSRFRLTMLHSTHALVAGALLLGGTNLAQAQEAEAAGAMMLEEVVVTARKMAENLQEAPLAITAITSLQLENMNLRSLEDVSKITAGLIFDSEFGRGSNRPVIRGQANILGDSGVSYFVDGVYVSGSIDDYDIDDVERIEVVKGPQSALYGRNTYSGAINIITKSPGEEFGGRVKAIIASDDQYDISASIRGPATDTIGWGLTARHYERGGIFTNTYDGSEIGEQQSDSVSGVLEFNPAENLRIRARAYYAQTEDGQPPIFATSSSDNNCYFDRGTLYLGRGRYFCGVVEPGPISSDYSRQVPDAQNSWDILQTSLSIDYDINDVWLLTSITGYNERDNISLTDGDYTGTAFQVSNFTPRGFPLTGGRPPPWPYTFAGGITDFTFANASDEKEWSQELRLAFNSGPWSGLIGGYYYDGSDYTRDIRELPPGAQDLANANMQAEQARIQAICNFNPTCTTVLAPSAALVVPRDQNNLDITNWAVFGLLSYNINDAWRITGEARYADEEISQRAIVQDLGKPVESDVSAKASFDSFNPRVTLDWQVTDANMLYLLYAEGNKPGGFNGTVAIEAGIPIFDEETVDSIEFGSKNTLLDGQMTANFAFYYNEVQGYQLTQNVQSGQNTTSATVNAGDADVKGWEAEFVLRPFNAEGLTILLNYAYNDSEFTRGVDANQGVLNDVLDDGLVNCSLGKQFPDLPCPLNSVYGSIVGKQIPRTARNQFFLDLDYRRPFGSGVWEWFAGTNYYRESSKFAQVHNLAETGETELVNGRLGIQNDRWMFQLWANNLTDEDNAVQVLRYAEPNAFLRNFAVQQRRGTHYGLTATLNF